MLQRLLLLTGVLSAPAPLPAQDLMTMVIREIAPKSWVISGFTNGNILAAAGRTGILLVDGQSEKRVALADSALRTVSSLPVGVVVNTHYHEDHISGNPWWRRKGADIVGTEALVIEARKDTTIPELDWHRTAAVPEALPNITFRDSLPLTLDGERILVLHPPAAHTGGDAIIWFPARNILHTGDILEREAPPFIDWWAGGSLDGMIAGVDFINARIDDRTILVPGHGTPTDRAGLLAYREMLVAARDRITALVRDGNTRDAIVQARPLKDFEGMLGGERRAGQFVWQVARGLGAS
jgi:glyoxylase-like metal-dependent hydrolase (beta-lactamase superfamily II)